MKELPEWAKYVARDADGQLYAFETKPYKYNRKWQQSGIGIAKVDADVDVLFPNVEWSDEEPTEIVNMMTNHIQAGDPVNHPSHYNQGGIETLDLIKLYLTPEEYEGYLKGNIIKYRERAQFKGNAEQDYAKAKFYYDEVSK